MNQEDKETFNSMMELFNSPDQEARDMGGQIFLSFVTEDLNNFAKDWCFKIFVENIKASDIDISIVKEINNKFLHSLKVKEVRDKLEKITINNIVWQRSDY